MDITEPIAAEYVAELEGLKDKDRQDALRDKYLAAGFPEDAVNDMARGAIALAGVDALARQLRAQEATPEEAGVLVTLAIAVLDLKDLAGPALMALLLVAGQEVNIRDALGIE